MDLAWYGMEAEDVLHALRSSLKGLSDKEAKLRLHKFGYNELKKRRKASPLQIFLAQFKNTFVIMLLVAILISVMIGWFEAKAAAEPHAVIETYVDAIAIGVIVILNAIVGFVQEFRSEKAMEAMEKNGCSQSKSFARWKRHLHSSERDCTGGYPCSGNRRPYSCGWAIIRSCRFKRR